MSKGLEAFKHIVEIVDFYTKEKKYYDMRFFPQCDEALWLVAIEKELKQAEENEKMLNVFKNALTIERKPINNTHAFKKDRENCISSFVSEIIEIKQNELDSKLRSDLREWVLKNAFPKELKALEILRECNLTIDEFNKKFDFISGKVPKDKVDLLKEVLKNE